MANSQTIPLSYWVDSIINLIVLYILRYTKKATQTQKGFQYLIYTYMIEKMNFSKNLYWVSKTGLDPALKIGRPDKFKPSLHPQKIRSHWSIPILQPAGIK